MGTLTAISPEQTYSARYKIESPECICMHIILTLICTAGGVYDF